VGPGLAATVRVHDAGKDESQPVRQLELGAPIRAMTGG
jgi:hypothetical protein